MTTKLDITQVLEQKSPAMIELLDACQRTSRLAKKIDYKNLRLTPKEAKAIYKKFDSALALANEIKEQLAILVEQQAHLNELVKALNCKLDLTNANNEVVTFHLKPQMIQTITFNIDQESMYDDEGGSYLYYQLDNVTVTIDLDIAMAMSPAFFLSDGEELSEEALNAFVESFQEDVAEQLYEVFESQYFAWQAYEECNTITQAQLAMAHAEASTTDLPNLYVPR